MPEFRFEVALSFPGDHRARVEKVAEALAGRVGKHKILYDRWHQAEFARPNLDLYLEKLYREQSHLLVFFLCAEYEEKSWCGLEWRAGRDLLKQKADDRLMLLRLDDAEIAGLSSIDGYLDIREMEPEELAGEIVNRLAMITAVPAIAIDQMVRDLRARSLPDIQHRCGKIRILTMEQPIELAGIYTDVNLLEKRASNLRKSLEELIQQAKLDDRLGMAPVSQRVPGLEAVDRNQRTIIYGKPGAGKTTFLKRLAMECAAGRFPKDLVPAFVTLRDFAETEGNPKLLAYLQDQWGGSASCYTVLKEGRALVLLDGLDEVRDQDFTRVRKAIELLTSEFPLCSIALTCRIAAREYSFERFTEVEMADFNEEQIQIFARRWFAVHGTEKRAGAFIEKLKANQPIFELASSPLLLTLLLLVFQERNDFDGTRAELYREGLDVLLRKWDAKRGIERDRPYGLTITDMETLLGEIAYRRFLTSDYFFDQASLEKQIETFFDQRSFLKPGEELVPELVLNSIESHLGLLVQRAVRVYSFSHLTFQEYLTAQRVARKPTLLSEIGPKVGDPRWREVWLLLVTMVDADDIIPQLKRLVDSLVEGESRIQQYLEWCSRKAAAHGGYKPSAVRAFYFDPGFARDGDRARALAPLLDSSLEHALHFSLDFALDIDIALGLARDRERALDQVHDPARALAKDRILDHALERAGRDAEVVSPDLVGELEMLRGEMPQLEASSVAAWRERLRAAIGHREIGHDWNFTKGQRDAIDRYNRANRLLVDCMNAARGLTNQTRQFIEDTMLLPAEELRRRG